MQLPQSKKTYYVVALAIAFIVVLALYPMPRNVFSYAVRATMDAGHFFAFGLLAALLFHYAIKLFHRKQALLYSAAATLALVILIEIIQPLFDRTAALNDVLLSSLGVVTFLSVRYLFLSQATPRLRHTGLAMLFILSLSVLYPVCAAWYAVTWHWLQTPQLGMFENELELHFWRSNEVGRNASRVKISQDYASEGRSSLQVIAGKTQWSGAIFHADNMDWGDYQELSVDVYNPGKAFNLSVRIDDDGDTTLFHQRFNKTYAIDPGWQTLHIPMQDLVKSPKNRSLNIHSVQDVLFFVTPSSPTRTFYLDNVHLK